MKWIEIFIAKHHPPHCPALQKKRPGLVFGKTKSFLFSAGIELICGSVVRQINITRRNQIILYRRYMTEIN